MNLKDLTKSVVFDDVWAELNKAYSMKDGALEAYRKRSANRTGEMLINQGFERL